MERLGYYDGKFGPLEEMTVPFLDRVSFYGDGVYDANVVDKQPGVYILISAII